MKEKSVEDVLAFREAVLYTRFSPKPKRKHSAGGRELSQEELDKDSCENQESILREWCRKHDVPECASFRDAEVSGGDETEARRRGLYAALSMLNTKRFLLVYKWDRLARSVFFSEWVERAVKNKKSFIVAAADSGNGESRDSKTMRQMLAIFAENSRVANAARTSACMLERQKNGQRMGGKPPYGWRPVQGKVELIEKDPHEQEVVAEILRLRRGGLGYRLIGKRLNESKMFKRNGKAWQDVEVGRVIHRAERDGYMWPEKEGGEA